MTAFETKLNGTLYGLMNWRDWDALRTRLQADADARWFVYAVGEALPEEPLPQIALAAVLTEIDTLLRRDHDEDYLGIVYADELMAPSLIKIYDPNNLGSSCGSIGFKVAPGWILSQDPPQVTHTVTPLPGNRKRWWQALRDRLQPNAA